MKFKRFTSLALGAIMVLTLIPAFSMGVAAKPKAETYLVTFMDNGLILDAQAVESGEAAEEPGEPERCGYTFAGWSKDFDYVTSDLTVYARWQVNTYEVTFMDGDEELDVQTVEHGSPAIAPETMTKEGYIFTGWDTWFTCVTSDITVTAQWELDETDEEDADDDAYLVIFIDGAKVVSTQTVPYGQPAKAPKVKRRGYTHSGWNTKFDKVEEDLIVWAQWTPKTVNLTFDANGGRMKKTKTKTKIIRRKYGKQIKLTKKPVRKGYMFKGWYTKKAGGKAINQYTKAPPKDKTYYAHWKKK